jgi:hypothetical protein
METMELKSELIDLIESIEDNKILSAIYILLTKQYKIETKVDFWDELPEDVKNDIDAAVEEGKRGEGISHEEAMKQVKGKLELL